MTKYSIGEFANKVGLTTYTLRYYEKEKLILPKRDENDRRYYTEQDIKWVGFLLHLKGTGMLMNEIKEYVQLRAQGDSTIKIRRELLSKVQHRSLAQIEEMKMHLKILSHKIDWYDGKLDKSIDESFADYLKRFQ
ncbi:MerR family transcriptional regulator [Apilactobacillus micheneri]|uniref:MerR family transcriptional regulator n=1 Tax=Apilactobacillus micheneri TaxID=1899430 RepID=UPI00112BE9F3|nr:MerR family transcriptional regulator [Apilactobacillus micheneri]TPR42987.1 MerR family transcriptional regulator [Apilactobacillus micheneri]TPR47319.1 MerR family transcriptional regulator [Apilactobacillus micheneri]TPR51025.1 MerR family transcriptional regulator [Apilactobacillus micheneri]